MASRRSSRGGIATLSDEQLAQLHAVVERGQLEFINGGWCMHDEATTHYTDMIDQTALGHRFIRQQFGEKANPKAGWQIDTFGHSATHVALLTGEVGLDGLLFARIDAADFRVRTASKALEWIWRPSPSLGQQADVFRIRVRAHQPATRSGSERSDTYTQTNGQRGSLCKSALCCTDCAVCAWIAVLIPFLCLWVVRLLRLSVQALLQSRLL